MLESAPPATRDGFTFAAFLSALWVRRWLVALVSIPVGLSVAAIIWYMFPAEYTARAVLQCKLGKPSHLDLTTQKDNTKEEIAQAQRNLLALVHNPKVISAAIDSISPDRAIFRSIPDKPSWLANNLRAGFSDDTEYMTISLSGLHPQDQADIINAVARSLKDEVKDEAKKQRITLTTRLAGAIKKITTDINIKRKSLLEKEKDSRPKGAADPELQLSVATIANLSAKQIELKAELDRTKELSKQAKEDLEIARQKLHVTAFEALIGCTGELTPQLKAPPLTVTIEAGIARSPAIIKQTKVLLDAEKALNDRMATVLPDHSTLPPLKAKVDAAKAELQKVHQSETEAAIQILNEQAVSAKMTECTQLDRSVDQLTKRIQLIEGELKKTHDKLNGSSTLVSTTVEVERMRKEIEQLEEMYKILKDKSDKLEFDLDETILKGLPESEDERKTILPLLTSSDAVLVVSEASTPRFPDVKGQMVRTAGSGIGTAVLVALGIGIWELSRRRLRTREEVMARVGLRVLGTLPQVRNRAALNPAATAALGPPGRNVFGDHADSIRTLLLNCETPGTEGVPVRASSRVIVVTSASPAEGKSILAINLVASLARAGKKTLLVDADLRRPSLHTSLGRGDHAGLSELLLGVVETEEAVQHLSPGLDFIAAGLACDEGLEALGRVDHVALVGEFLKDYDVVVLDTPPILSAPDGLILGGVADGVLLAVRSGISHTEEVCEASRLLDEAGCRVLGAVLNGVATNRSVYNYRNQKPVAALEANEDESPQPREGRKKATRKGGVS